MDLVRGGVEQKEGMLLAGRHRMPDMIGVKLLLGKLLF